MSIQILRKSPASIAALFTVMYGRPRHLLRAQVAVGSPPPTYDFVPGEPGTQLPSGWGVPVHRPGGVHLQPACSGPRAARGATGASATRVRGNPVPSGFGYGVRQSAIQQPDPPGAFWHRPWLPGPSGRPARSQIDARDHESGQRGGRVFLLVHLVTYSTIDLPASSGPFPNGTYGELASTSVATSWGRSTTAQLYTGTLLSGEIAARLMCPFAGVVRTQTWGHEQ